jgi:hypothetical protein
MFLLFAAALLASDDPSATKAVPERNARAMVLIVRPAELRFKEIQRDQPELLRDTVVQSADGQVQPAKLVEFQ